MTTYRDAADDDVYLMPNEVATLFDVSSKTITRWAVEGKLPHLRTLGGHRRYKLGEMLRIRSALDHTGDAGE